MYILCHIIFMVSVSKKVSHHYWILYSFMSKPHLSRGIWWLLSDFLVVPSQHSWFGQANGIVPRHASVHLNHWNRSVMKQFVQNRDCWLSTIKKSPIIIVIDPYLMRGWGLGSRLCYCARQHRHLMKLHGVEHSHSFEPSLSTERSVWPLSASPTGLWILPRWTVVSW